LLPPTVFCTITQNYSFLLRITSAAITPGTHPQDVSRSVMRIEPHPLSMTARGGKIKDNNTLPKDMVVFFSFRSKNNNIFLLFIKFASYVGY
jgi:hypothetical protein